jgi:hypothetical protein
MEDVQFDQLNTAAYSPRPHTPAALWDNQAADLPAPPPLPLTLTRPLPLTLPLT